MAHNFPSVGPSGVGSLVTGTPDVQASTVVERDSNGDSSFNAVNTATILKTTGSFYLDQQAKSANFSPDESSVRGTLYAVTCSSANITVTLPAAASYGDKIIAIQKADATAYTVILDGDSADTIAGKATFTLYSKFDTLWIQSDGTSNWRVIHASMSPAVVAKTADFTVDDQPYTEFVYVVTPAAATIATLPAAAALGGRVVTFKRISGSTNNLVVDGNASEAIDGAATKTSATDRAILRIICDGTGWHIVSTLGTWS